MYVHDIDPVMFSVGWLAVRYYGLFYFIGLAIYFFILRSVIKKDKELSRKLGGADADVLDLVVYSALGMFIGARVFYFVFYNPWTLAQSPLELFRIWNGGMSFHGGFLGLAAALFIISKRKGLGFFALSDLFVMPAGIVLFLGRIGNFINAELFGRVTDVPWAVDFGDGLPRHPSQIYEALKNLVIFSAIWAYKKLDPPRGALTFMFMLLYGALRFGIEFFREPDPQLGLFAFGLSMGQMLCIIMVLTGSVMLWLVLKRKVRLS